MLEQILTVVHGAVLLLFGDILSFQFAGVRLDKKVLLHILLLFAFSAGLQLLLFFQLSEFMVIRAYPLIVHLPVLLVLCLGYRKNFSTALAAVATVYMCCQPSKWFGALLFSLFPNSLAELAVQILALPLVFFLIRKYLVPSLRDFYSKDVRGALVFGMIPLLFYLFDYITAIYTDLRSSNNQAVLEAMPMFLFVTFASFCIVYHDMYEAKAEAERKENILQITAQQQAKEMEAFQENEQSLRILRHDMRMLLENVSACVENGDTESARKLISGYVQQVDRTAMRRYADNDIIHYTLTNYAAKCSREQIAFEVEVELPELKVSENAVSSILSNALENAINAQKGVPQDKRQIRVMLKNTGRRMLISVKNTYGTTPVLVDGMPVTKEKGHGYGTQSIRYLAEKLDGKCQFLLQDGLFVLRVIL